MHERTCELFVHLMLTFFHLENDDFGRWMQIVGYFFLAVARYLSHQDVSLTLVKIWWFE